MTSPPTHRHCLVCDTAWLPQHRPIPADTPAERMLSDLLHDGAAVSGLLCINCWKLVQHLLQLRHRLDGLVAELKQTYERTKARWLGLDGSDSGDEAQKKQRRVTWGDAGIKEEDHEPDNESVRQALSENQVSYGSFTSHGVPAKLQSAVHNVEDQVMTDKSHAVQNQPLSYSAHGEGLVAGGKIPSWLSTFGPEAGLKEEQSSTADTAEDSNAEGSSSSDTSTEAAHQRLREPGEKGEIPRTAESGDVKNEAPSPKSLDASSAAPARRTEVKPWTRVEGPTPYECLVCLKQFQYLASVKVHAVTHTGEKKYTCEHCGRKFALLSTLKTHRRTHSDERPFKCALCDKAFNQQAYLIRHQIVHSSDKPFCCEVCGKTFKQSYYLTIHMRFHSGEKPYKCDECGKDFPTISNLNKHAREHTGLPFTCEVCGKSFRDTCHLRDHQRLHTGERPFACSDCGMTFNLAKILSRHMRIHSGEKPYICNLCNKAFARSENLKDHMKQHAEPRQKVCDVGGSVDGSVLSSADVSLMSAPTEVVSAAAGFNASPMNGTLTISVPSDQVNSLSMMNSSLSMSAAGPADVGNVSTMHQQVHTTAQQNANVISSPTAHLSQMSLPSHGVVTSHHNINQPGLSVTAQHNMNPSPLTSTVQHCMNHHVLTSTAHHTMDPPSLTAALSSDIHGLNPTFSTLNTGVAPSSIADESYCLVEVMQVSQPVEVSPSMTSRDQWSVETYRSDAGVVMYKTLTDDGHALYQTETGEVFRGMGGGIAEELEVFGGAADATMVQSMSSYDGLGI